LLRRCFVKAIYAAFAIAVILAVMVEIMLEYLHVPEAWRPVVLTVAGILGFAMLVHSLTLLSRRRRDEERVGVILPSGFKSLELSIWRRIWRWLKEN
ncbi:MAG: hypothetical protein AB1467_07525, partial [Candidatus Diapherotrites archaeon]